MNPIFNFHAAPKTIFIPILLFTKQKPQVNAKKVHDADLFVASVFIYSIHIISLSYAFIL